MEIWLVELDRAGAALETLEAARPRLSDCDVMRLRAVADPTHRRQRRAAAIALRLAIARAAGDGRFDRVAFTHSRSGKPALPDGNICFSLSHTHDRALIAVAPGGPLGIDVEDDRPLAMSAVRRQALIAAAAALADEFGSGGLGGDGEVLRAWVRLEAYAKARGCGIGRVLTDAGVLAPSVAARRAAAGESGATWPHTSGLGVRDLVLPGPHQRAGFAALAAPSALLNAAAGISVHLLPATLAGLDSLVGSAVATGAGRK